MTNSEILRIAMEQHAIDANCSPEDFRYGENIVVISKQHKKAKRYFDLPFFCHLIYYGNNIVASVDERIYDFAKQYIDTPYPENCFDTPRLHRLTKALQAYGFSPGYMSEYWLPDTRVLQALSCSYEVHVLEQNDFADLYLPEWSNALSKQRKHLDMVAIGAYDADRLIGLAGCSADSDTMWQIGIDVLPNYRRQGVAAALTSQLAVEVIARNKVPFYCCAWANIGSARNAIKSEFRPAWAELTAIKTDLTK